MILMGDKNRKITFILAGLSAALVIGAIVVGISDNIPGIVLCLTAVILLFIAFTHSWRELKKFLILTGASLGGFFLFVLLHNVFYGLGVITGGIPVVSQFMEFSHAAFFCIALFVCPPGFVVGAVASIVLGIKKLRDKQR